MMRRVATALCVMGAARALAPAPLRLALRTAAAKRAVATVGLALMFNCAPAGALGPETIELTELTYADTGKLVGEPCAGRPLKPPGEKVAAGLLPKCVLVKAKSFNPKKTAVSDAGVFGYVKTATGDSVIANNPDFRSDAGQFTMIKLVPPGAGRVEFEFVAVIPDSKDALGELEFVGTKAVSYPGGKRMATFTECELDSLSDACDAEQEKFISK
ncbi:hypothetical protein M885DRAFT_508595 [Pelagophyceae sp. CCMP2097]|nr:hypothetical protein M885DRAFT_508595 [Pelagophyceae sp. CCMP2097]